MKEFYGVYGSINMFWHDSFKQLLIFDAFKIVGLAAMRRQLPYLILLQIHFKLFLGYFSIVGKFLNLKGNEETLIMIRVISPLFYANNLLKTLKVNLSIEE